MGSVLLHVDNNVDDDSHDNAKRENSLDHQNKLLLDVFDMSIFFARDCSQHT